MADPFAHFPFTGYLHEVDIHLTTSLTPAGNGRQIIRVPDHLAAQVNSQLGKHLVCRIGSGSFCCTLRWNRDIGHYIMVGKMNHSHFAIQSRQTITVYLSTDDFPLEERYPDSLKAVMDADPEGQSLFIALSEDKRRSLLRHISGSPSVETQVKRSLVILENLCRQKSTLSDLIRMQSDSALFHQLITISSLSESTPSLHVHLKDLPQPDIR